MPKLAIVVPCYHWVSTTFFGNFVMLDEIGKHPIAVTNGVYLTSAMVRLVTAADEEKSWDRLLVIEQDMLLPRDALVRHSNYTEPIVGSMYFRHDPPHHPIIATPKLDNYPPTTVERMLRYPKLYEVGAVGMGCTSIRRDVLESWPEDKPMWYLPSNEKGEVITSHDYYFCTEAKKHGYNTYVDSGLICRHLTEDGTSPMHYMAAVKTGFGFEGVKQELITK